MEKSKRLLTSKPALLGLFALLSLLLAIPLVVLLTQQKQDPRQFAAKSHTGNVKGIKTGSVTGYVYLDSNANGARDPEEKPYPHAAIRITTKENATYPVRDLQTDSYGYFVFRIENETAGAQIKLILPDGYKTSTANPITGSLAQKQIIEFGVTGSVSVTPKPTCIPRPTCLDSIPRCLATEPTTGWCPRISIFPTKPVKISPTTQPKPSNILKPLIRTVSPTPII